MRKKPEKYKNGTPKFDIHGHEYTVDGETFDFMGLCRHYGIKYQSMYWLVAIKGVEVNDAVKICISDPRKWGV